jgi:ribosomal protein S20
MSAKQSTAIRTLVRWREFQEALAERECQQASARVLEAQSAVDEAQSVAAAIQARRDELVGAQRCAR